MSNFTPTYTPYGEQGILIAWPSEINEAILTDVLAFKRNIENSNNKEISEVRSAYNSLLVVFNKLLTSFSEEIRLLRDIHKFGDVFKPASSKLWKIPVCYNNDLGLDLEEMASAKKMSISDIIIEHSTPIYTVYFIGFLPGFLYLGGLNKNLFTPRKATPRLKINKGAVAIGGNQTGVYPNESPGGWNIIGHSPIDFFNPKHETPCFAKAGDRLQFYPVSLNDYKNIKALVQAKVYQIESEDWHD